MKSYFVSGANRGLGLEIVRQLAASPDAIIVATARDPSAATELRSLASSHGDRIVVLKLDHADPGSVEDVARELSALPQISQLGLDALILNAGTNVGSLDSATEMKMSDLKSNIEANLFGPIQLTTALLPFLEKGKDKKIFSVGTVAASLTLNIDYIKPGSMASYGPSKAAMSAWLLRLQQELPDFTVIIYHPGLIDTGMTVGFPPEGMVSPGQSAASLIKCLHSTSIADSGKFFRNGGAETVAF